jgi:ubiquinone/menaquinone biosynthesis C-methylase UbiE
MNSWLLSILRCPETGQTFQSRPGLLVRSDGKIFPDKDGIASLVFPASLSGADARMNRLYERLAPFYALSERVLGRVVAGVDVLRERQKLVSLLGLQLGLRLLEVSPGPGVYQPLLRKALGPQAEMAALDLSLAMLRQCRRHHAALGIELVHGNAQHLPFAEESFDALFHFGGVNLFNQPAKALSEFVRVVRKGGIVSWGDEQLSEHYRRRHPWRSKVLRRLNPGYLQTPPAVPGALHEVQCHEVCQGLGYLVVARRDE